MRNRKNNKKTIGDRKKNKNTKKKSLVNEALNSRDMGNKSKKK